MDATPSPSLALTPLHEDWPLSCDGLFQRALTIYQHQKGYRFSIDAVLLAAFALERSLLRFGTPSQEASSSSQSNTPRHTGQVRHAADLCSGSGVVALAALFLMDRYEEAMQREHPLSFQGLPVWSWYAVELQASLAALARANRSANRREQHIEIHEIDLRRFAPKKPIQLVTCNPPYQAHDAGSISQHPERAIARHLLQGSLEEITASTRTLLPPDGIALFVFPEQGRKNLLRALQRADLHPLHLREIMSFSEEQPRLLLIEASPSPRMPFVTSSLTLYAEKGRYTDLMEALLQGDPMPWLSRFRENPY
jgi:tRNA1Val (adenine37-N6)-methyltransferase